MPEEQESIRVEMPPARRSDRMRLYWWCWRCFTRGLFTVAFQGRVLGARNVPREGGVLLVSNHQSFFAPFLASLAFDRECNYMARETLFLVPLLTPLIRSLNAFPVRRNTADLRAIKETLRRLKMGQMVLVFPEGTRSPDGRIGPMQPGVAAVAKQAKVSVVPMLIEGAYDVWPRHAVMPRPAKVVIKYAPAITPEEVQAASKEALLERIDRTIRRMQVEVRRVYGWHPLPDRPDASMHHEDE